MLQVGLLSAGCQPWNVDVCDCAGKRFAYCASLAVYVYEVCPAGISTRADVVDLATRSVYV